MGLRARHPFCINELCAAVHEASVPTAAARQKGNLCSLQHAAGAQHALLALYLSLSRRAAALMPLLGSFLICMSLGSSGFTMLARTLSCTGHGG